MAEQTGKATETPLGRVSNIDQRAENRRRARQKIFDSMPGQIEAIRRDRERKSAELAQFMAAREVKEQSA